MKVTKATIKKAIRELGLDVSNFEISAYRGCAPRIETLLNTSPTAIKRGNAQVRKVVKHLKAQGADFYGTMTGYGTWVYKFEAMSYSTWLAHNNID